MNATGVLPLWLASALYVWQTWEFYRAGNLGMALTFSGYTLANFGLIYAATRG
jgi:hypothetical protein